MQDQMDMIVDGMASLEGNRQRDASPWQDMRGDASASCSYNPGDSEQLPYDVPLPMGLIQDHPEPLLIDRRFITGSEGQVADKDGQDNALGGDGDFDNATNKGGGCGSEDSGGAMPVCNAEPMTQEEAEAFDQTSMGSCFLEFGAFGMSQMSRSGASEGTLRTPASQNAAEALKRFQATGALPRPSMDGSSRMQASGSTEGDPSSNRSSFDMVPPAASSRLYNSWDGSCNAPEGAMPVAQQAMLGRPAAAAAAADARHKHIEDCQAAAQQGAKGGAPGNARAAHQALMGLPDSRPRLALSQQQLVQANKQQLHVQQGSPMEVQQGQPMQAQPHQQQQRRGTTPVLQQSHMQLSLGMGLGLTLDLGSWCYGPSSDPGQAGAPGGVQGGGVTPRASAATHRRRAGVPVEDYPSDQVPVKQQQTGDMVGWPLPAGVAAASLQNVRTNHLGTALTVADLLGLPAKVQQAGMQRAGFPQPFVKQEAPQHREVGVVVPRPIEELHFAAEEAGARNPARMPSRIGGQELSVRHESLVRYRDKKRRRMFSNAKTIRYEKRKVNADRRPRVKGRFVKQMDVDAGLEMIKEHAQLPPPPPECHMEHASDGDCSADEEDPSHITIRCSDDRA